MYLGKGTKAEPNCELDASINVAAALLNKPFLPRYLPV